MHGIPASPACPVSPQSGHLSLETVFSAGRACPKKQQLTWLSRNPRWWRLRRFVERGCYEMKLRAALHLHGRSRHNAAGRGLMGADNQAEGVPERKRLSAIAKIKQDLAWRSVAGVPMMKNIILTRGQAEELVAEFERLSSQGGKA
jgi:hypothetical protein